MQKNVISDMSFLERRFGLLYLLVSLVYLTGLFIPLMENDSAQHASMAMKMVLNGDFLHLYKGNAPYLDKPHLHFWLSGWAMQLFGINHIAYRLPALFFLALGAYCTYQLTKRLYPFAADTVHTARDFPTTTDFSSARVAAHLAALIFLLSQTIILSGHDVRTDAVLTGAVILSIYHFVAFIQDGRARHAIWGGLGMAMALGSKGMVGVGIIGLFVLCYLLYSRQWQGLFRWKLGLAVLSLVIGIAPILYAYYVQFDMNPELLVHDRQGVSGVRFILWDQSFNRFSGTDFGEANSDYFFFFHSLLWMFIPFSLVFYTALFRRTAFFIRRRFAREPGYEFLTVGGFWTVMLVFSFSEFKLPHYLNSLVPMLSVLTAVYLVRLAQDMPTRVWESRMFLYVHYALIAVGLALTVYISAVAFPPSGFWSGLLLILVLLGWIWIGRVLLAPGSVLIRFIYSALLFAVTLNIYLNTQFYPPLAQYQAGLQVAERLESQGIAPQDVVMLEHAENWTLDFYTATNIPRLSQADLAATAGSGKFLMARAAEIEDLEDDGFRFEQVLEVYRYRITQVKPAFLNPRTRADQLEQYQLVRILSKL